MHQSSIMTSRELRLRIEPTGQPTQAQRVAALSATRGERYWSKRKPSRMSRVMPSCASAQALTHASQRVQFCKSKNQQALALPSVLARGN